MEKENLEGENKKSSILKKKEIWISGIIGIILGAAIVYLLVIFGVAGIGSKTIATVKQGRISEKDLYKEIEKSYPISYMLEIVDKQILDKKYTLTEAQENEINEQVDLILEQYQNYGYTEETFLKENGFDSKEDFVNYMKLDYRRNLCCIDYFKTLISEEEINNYYNDNDIYGEIHTKHMLVQVTDEVTDEEALKTANEIIAKLNSGISFDDVANEYEDKVTYQDVDINSFNEEQYISSYVEASKALDKDTYTKEAVKTDYGYHVIYCADKEDKPSFEDVENDIVEKLAEDLEAEDQYIRYKALIKLREDNKLKFKDNRFEEEYKEYCEQVNG